MTQDDVLRVARMARYTITSMSFMSHGQYHKDESGCSICLSECSYPVLTKCKHSFCFSCLHRWISKQASCPLCRTFLLSSDVLLYRRTFLNLNQTESNDFFE
jgi:hypothetical protein